MGHHRAQKLRDEAPTPLCVLWKRMRETGFTTLVTFKEDLLVSSHSVQCSALRGVLLRGGEGLSCPWASQFWVMANRGLALNPSQTQTRASTLNRQLCCITVGAAKNEQRFFLQVLSTSSDSRVFWWSWMIGRLLVELYIFMNKAKNNQTVSSYNCPHKIKTNRLFPFLQWWEQSSVIFIESYRLRAREDSVRSGVFLGISC